MSRPLHRRLIALEHVPANSPTVYCVFSTSAEAEAAAALEPVPRTVVVRIITGVPRWSEADAS